MTLTQQQIDELSPGARELWDRLSARYDMSAASADGYDGCEHHSVYVDHWNNRRYCNHCQEELR